MRYKEICHLVHVPLTQRDYVRFGVERLQVRGYEVKVVDLTMVLNPEYARRHQDVGMSDYPGLVRMQDRKELTAFFRNRQNCFVVDFINGSAWNAFIYQTFWAYNIPYANLRGNMPVPLPKGGLFWCRVNNLLRRLLSGSSLKQYWEKKGLILYDLSPRLSRIRPPDVILAACRQYGAKLPKERKETRVVWAHTFDYDRYLEQEGQALTAASEPYTVFLDEYSPYHPDRLLLESKTVEPVRYYRGLNVFFDWFEKEFKTKVVIAAHPRSRYDLKPECFPNREVYLNKTIELVRGAKYVLAQGSTSINFAVLYRKPIIFLTSDAMNAEGREAFLLNYAQQFGKRPINIDYPETFADMCNLGMDVDQYVKYCENYIKVPGSPDKFLWDIFADAIENIN